MKKDLRNLIFMYLGFVLVKAILSYFIPSSRALADDYNYLKMSESFFYHFSLKVHGTFTGQFYPLYPIMISVSHIFNDNNLVYFAIKFINSILSSLIIFPAYYLSKEFLSEKKALLSSAIISLLPANFALTAYIMAENLFYSLFLISIYYIYKLFKDKNLKYYFLAGLFTVLTLSTRIHGLILIALIYILIITEKINKKIDKRYFWLLILIIPFIIWFYYFKDLVLNLYILKYLSLIKFKFLLAFFIKYISYFGFLLLGSGLILMLPLLMSFKIKNSNLKLFRKISLITILISLFLATIHALGSIRYFYSIGNLTLVSGRVIGRYIDFVLPLIVILSFIGLDYYFNNKNRVSNALLKKFTIILFLIMLFTTSIIFSSLVPLNNISLTTFGALKYLIDIIFYNKVSFEFGTTVISFLILSLIFILIPLVDYYLLKKFSYRRFISLLLIFVTISSFISLAAVYYAAKTSWYYNSEQRQLALYLNNIDKKRSIVLIDERDEGDLVSVQNDPNPGRNEKALYGGTEKSKYTIIGYWLNDELIIGDINDTKADYIISTYNLNLKKLYQTSNGIYLYKNESK